MSALHRFAWVLAVLALLAGGALLSRWMPDVSHVPPSLPTAEPILLPDREVAPGPTHETETEEHSIRSSQGIHAGVMAF